MDLNIIDSEFYIVEKSDFFIKYTEQIQGFRVFENDNYLYFINKIKGVVFVFIDNKLSGIHFYGKNHMEYNSFEDDLPFNIDFSDSMLKVSEKFGKFEIKKGGGEIIPIIGKSNYWKMFLIDGNCFRFEFKNEEIVLITLSNLYK